MPRRVALLGLLATLSVGCADPSNTPLAPPDLGPMFSLSGGGTAWISGPTTLTTSGNHFYQACTSGLSQYNTYYAKIFTSKDGEVGYGGFTPPYATCWGQYVWADSNTANFTVWAKIYNTLGSYLGDSDTISVTVNIPAPPLSVSITGDDTVAPDEECAWQAWTSGGTGPYTYNWWGGVTGTAQTVYGSLSQSETIWVAVSDATAQADTAQFYVSVDGGYSCQER